jgi:hypothetical protein
MDSAVVRRDAKGRDGLRNAIAAADENEKFTTGA